MKPIRFRMHAVMTWVALVALNLGVGRILFSSRRFDILIGGAMIWIMVQIGALRAYRRRGRARACWLGFAGGGLLVGISIGLGRRFPASVFARLWRSYSIALNPLLDRILHMLERNFGYTVWLELAAEVVMAMVWFFLPAVLSACVAGFLVRMFSDRSGRTPKVVTGPAGS